MTLVEFQNAHIFPTGAPVLGAPDMHLNLLYNTYDGVDRLDAISIRKDGLLQQLQQATALTFKVPRVGNYITIQLYDPNLPVQINQVGEYFFYFIAPDPLQVARRPTITPNATPDPATGIEVYSTELIIAPYLAQQSYVASDYNALYSSNAVDRTSDYAVKSDREASKLHPTNLSTILGGSAAAAPIQDSNYTSTGWSNARYRGSKITSVDNQGIDPFIQGTFFEAAFFSKDVDDLYISELAPSDLILKQFFFSGKLNSLQYTLEDINAKISSTFYDHTTQIYLRNRTASPVIPALGVGDLFRVFSESVAPKLSAEIMQMIPPVGNQQYYPYITYDTSNPNITSIYMQVKRGYNATRKDAQTSYDSTVYRIVPIKVYDIRGSSIQSLTEGKLRVSGEQEVIYIDGSGLVVGGSNPHYIPEMVI